MKKWYFIIFLVVTFILEIAFSIIIVSNKIDYKNNMVIINDTIHKIEENYGDSSKYSDACEYTILDEKDNVIYKSNGSDCISLYEAYRNGHTVIDFNYDKGKLGKIIIINDIQKKLERNNNRLIITISIISGVQLISFIGYYIYLHKRIIDPFKKMNDFASRVSTGNLDIPLEMDKNNNFGAFTEAFDIMRSEIKKAREAEKKANDAKKELVAKLSHDIKTPIASIKSYSELGLAISDEDKRNNCFKSIDNKTEQINVLITNLFNSTLEELEELKINPTEINSNIIINLINQADYLKKNKIIEMPKCNVYADKLRLQQVFDNAFANSYKYANTNIETNAYLKNEYLIIEIRDFGTNFSVDELPLLTEKFKRGSNTTNKDGSGLGLYISKELLKKMNGDLEITSANPGFKVLVYLRII